MICPANCSLAPCSVGLGRSCERRVQAARTARPAPTGSGTPLAPRRAPASRLARSGVEVRNAAERHTECLAFTTSRQALSSPIVSAGWQALVAADNGRAPREAQCGQISLFCPPDGRTPSGGQEGRLGLTVLSADSERPLP
jgi:hypothetical protein